MARSVEDSTPPLRQTMSAGGAGGGVWEVVRGFVERMRDLGRGGREKWKAAERGIVESSRGRRV